MKPMFLSLLTALVFTVGCTPTVRLAAPEEPIEINLNVKIDQEVRVRVDRDLDNLFENDPELFGVK